MKRLNITLLAAAVALSVSAAAPNGSGTYYQAADGKKAAALKTALCSIVQTTVEHDYGDLWTDFRTTDKRSDGKVWDMYSSITNFTFGTDQAGSYQKEGDVYNREHSFPKSWFGGEIKPMYTDLHHMYPTDGFVNNKRGNYPFGEVSSPTYSSSGGFSKLGPCSYSGYTGTVFEPADEYKGDFARTYFYMVTRYEEKLSDWYSKNSESRATINGTTYPAFQTWQLNMLMEWATNDPVSEKEVARINAVYGIQKNRNPFIDYPGLEQYIWGSKKNDAFSYDNYVQPDGSSSGGGGDTPDPTPGGETEVVDVLNVTGWAEYTNDSYSASNTDKTGKSSTTNVSYAMQVYNGKTGGVRGNQSSATSNFSCRNTTTYSGYYIKEVKLTVKSGTLDGSTSGRSVVYFGDSPFTTSPSGTATMSNENAAERLTLTWTNTDTSKNYFILYNLKTSGTTKTAVVTVTWGSTAPTSAVDPSFNNLSDVSVTYGSTLTLTQGTTGTPNFVTDGTVTLSSLNENVVTVDGLTITPVAVGTTMISVSTTATDAYNAGNVMFPVTVLAPEEKTEAYVEETTATLDFTSNSWGLPEGSTNKTTDSQNYTSGEYTITLAGGGSGNGYYFNSTDKYLLMGKSGATLTLPAFDKAVTQIDVVGKSGASTNVKQNIYVGNTAVSSETTGATGTNSYVINKLFRSAGNIYTLKVTSSHNTQITSVIVHFAESALTKTLNSYGYASYCSEYPLDFSDYESAGYSAWQVTGVSGETITFAQVTGKVTGGTGLILKGEPGETVTLHSAASTTTLDDNLLVGTIVDTYAETGQYFGLKGNEFVPVAASTVPAGKALLPASLIAGDEVKALNFVFEDEATSLSEELRVKSEEFATAREWYTLDGRKLNNKPTQRGIYIVNGKRILF